MTDFPIKYRLIKKENTQEHVGGNYHASWNFLPTPMFMPVVNLLQ